MALNKTFKLKDSLYVGTSGFFAGTPVSIDTNGQILSAGRDLADLFKCNSAALSQGNCITNFSYDGTSTATVAIDGTASGEWDAAYTWCSTNGDNVYDTVGAGDNQGQITLTNVGNSPDTIYITDLSAAATPTFAGLTLNGEIDMTSDKIVNVADPTSDQDAATKAYVDTTCGGLVDSVTAGNGTITIGGTAADPTVRITDACVTALSSAYCASASSTQGNIGFTLLNGGSDTLDIGLCTGDDVTFAGICATGNITTSGTVDGVDIATRDGVLTSTTTRAYAALPLSGGQMSGNITMAGAQTVDGVDISARDAVLTSTTTRAYSALPLSGGALTGNVTITNNCTIDGRCVGADGTKLDSIACNATACTGTVCGTGTENQIPLWSATAATIGNSIVWQSGTKINVCGSLSAVSLSGDGAGLTNVTATACFPGTGVPGGDLATTDKFFVNDGNNKNICYGDLLTDLAGTGITVESSDSLTIGDSMASDKVPYWTGSALADSIITRSASTITIGGDHLVTGSSTVYGDLSVTGDFTCLETIVSTTSALSVTNTGTGPALYVKQGGTQPIAHFIDQNGDDIVFADDGALGIGTFSPAEKLTVSGNISANGTLAIDGNTTLGNASGDSLTITGATVTATNLASGTENGNVLVRDSSNNIVLDSVDDKIFGSSLVTGSGTCNEITKWNGGDSISTSNITDTGSLVTIDSNTKVSADNSLSIYAAGGSIYAQEKTFTGSVGTGGTTVTTFAKSGFEAGKYIVTLIKGVNKTVFEILVTYNGTSSFGTVYGIVDAQATSQLDTVEVGNSGSTIDLVITSASATTTAIVHGKAFY